MDFYALRYEVSLNQDKASKIRPSEFRAIKYLSRRGISRSNG
jgi:hypothetical protein